MPRIDFYILENQSYENIFIFTCRLLEKAYQQNHKVFVLTSSLNDAKKLDDLLWTFNDISFIPHKLNNAENSENVPIIIGDDNPDENYHEILINLSENIPKFYKQFSRVIEIIPDQEPYKNNGRTKFSEYRNQDNELTTHKITNS